MLFFDKFLAKKNNTYKEKINTATDRRVTFYRFPGFFHLPTPMYIVEN